MRNLQTQSIREEITQLAGSERLKLWSLEDISLKINANCITLDSGSHCPISTKEDFITVHLLIMVTLFMSSVGGTEEN